jgi:hypothetical protein
MPASLSPNTVTPPGLGASSPAATFSSVLAAAGRADDRDKPAGADVEVHVAHHGIALAGVVFETNAQLTFASLRARRVRLRRPTAADPELGDRLAAPWL